MADSSSGDGAGESSLDVDANELLHEACRAGDVEKLRDAIAAGADVNVRLPHYETPHYSSLTPLCVVVSPPEVMRDRAEKGRTACIQALLAAGASASDAVVFYENVQGSSYTVMHDAAYHGFATICRLLLDAGAALNARDHDDTPPLQYAVIHKHHRTVVLFLSRGATTDGETGNFEEYHSPGYLERIERAGSFANYQKQQRAKLMAMLAPKMSHLLPPELVSHVITFWGHLGWT